MCIVMPVLLRNKLEAEMNDYYIRTLFVTLYHICIQVERFHSFRNLIRPRLGVLLLISLQHIYTNGDNFIQAIQFNEDTKPCL